MLDASWAFHGGRLVDGRMRDRQGGQFTTLYFIVHGMCR